MTDTKESVSTATTVIATTAAATTAIATTAPATTVSIPSINKKSHISRLFETLLSYEKLEGKSGFKNRIVAHICHLLNSGKTEDDFEYVLYVVSKVIEMGLCSTFNDKSNVMISAISAKFLDGKFPVRLLNFLWPKNITKDKLEKIYRCATVIFRDGSFELIVALIKKKPNLSKIVDLFYYTIRARIMAIEQKIMILNLLAKQYKSLPSYAWYDARVPLSKEEKFALLNWGLEIKIPKSSYVIALAIKPLGDLSELEWCVDNGFPYGSTIAMRDFYGISPELEETINEDAAVYSFVKQPIRVFSPQRKIEILKVLRIYPVFALYYGILGCDLEISKYILKDKDEIILETERRKSADLYQIIFFHRDAKDPEDPTDKEWMDLFEWTLTLKNGKELMGSYLTLSWFYEHKQTRKEFKDWISRTNLMKEHNAQKNITRPVNSYNGGFIAKIRNNGLRGPKGGDSQRGPVDYRFISKIRTRGLKEDF